MGRGHRVLLLSSDYSVLFRARFSPMFIFPFNLRQRTYVHVARAVFYFLRVVVQFQVHVA